MAPKRAFLKCSLTFRSMKNYLFLIYVSDFTMWSIEVIEDARFQNQYIITLLEMTTVLLDVRIVLVFTAIVECV